MVCRLVTLACVAPEDVFLNLERHFGPVVVALHELDCAVLAGVTCGGRVVAGLDHVVAKLLVRRYVKAALVIQKTVVLFPFEESVDEFAGSGLEGCKGGENIGFLFTGLSDAIFEWVGEFVGGGKFGE